MAAAGEESHALIERAFALFASPVLFAAAAGLLAAATLASALDAYDALHAAWFQPLLVLCALSWLALCLDRLPRAVFFWRHPVLRLDDARAPGRSVMEKPASITAEAVSADLQKRGYRIVRTPREGGGVELFAERGLAARFAGWLFALAAAAALGGVYTRLSSFEGTAELAPGTEVETMTLKTADGSAPRRHLRIAIRCDAVRTQPVLESDLRILEDGAEMARGTVGGQRTLEYGGLRFSQAGSKSTEEGARARIALLDKAAGREQQLTVGAGESVEAADGLEYQLVEYSEDFVGQGPAVRVVRVEAPAARQAASGAQHASAKDRDPRRVPPPGSKISTFWVFQRAPKFDADNRPDRFALRFEGLQQESASVIRIVRDDSLPFFLAAAALAAGGAALAAATSHRRIWARLADGKLALAGDAQRSAKSFDNELAELQKNWGLA